MDNGLKLRVVFRCLYCTIRDTLSDVAGDGFVGWDGAETQGRRHLAPPTSRCLAPKVNLIQLIWDEAAALD